MALAVPTLLALEQVPSLESVTLSEVNVTTLKEAAKSISHQWMQLSQHLDVMVRCRERFRSWKCRSFKDFKFCVEQDDYIRNLGLEGTPTECYVRAFNLYLRAPSQDEAHAFNSDFFEDVQVCMQVIGRGIKELKKNCTLLVDDLEVLNKIIELHLQKASRKTFYSKMKMLGIRIPSALGE